MHVLITDSGVGGLSVCAYAERLVRLHGFGEPVRLTFANAAPENDYGYNSMKSREEKLETFDRFLRNVSQRFAPDSIYVACNTLSVLLPDTPYFENAPIPVKGIVATGVELLLRELEANRESVAMIFATPTTIDAGTYARLLEERGIERGRIINQPCPGLADTISEDRQGVRTRSEIDGWVGKALAKMEKPAAPVIACLACTHYGYREELFAAELKRSGIRATVLNPNERAVDDLFGGESDPCREDKSRHVEVEFVTRYAISPTTLETLTWFLSEISPRTVAAMQHFVHLPNLF